MSRVQEAGCSKSPIFSPAQPQRAETRPSACAAAANIQRCSSTLAWIRFPLMAWMSPQLRASSSHPPTLAAPRRVLNPTRAFLFGHSLLRSHAREWPDHASLRASNDHSLIVGVPRARRMVWPLPPHHSETARCASTGDAGFFNSLLAGATRLDETVTVIHRAGWGGKRN
jgi:hypothetical protein